MNYLFTAGLWVIFHSLDYYLTLWAALWYQKGVEKHLNFAQGYELNPDFAGEVAGLQWFSLKMLFTLVLGFLLLWGLPQVISLNPGTYAFLAGFLLLGKVTLLIRHLGNLTLFYQILNHPEQVKGQINYGKQIPLRSSAAGFLGFSLAYLGFYFLDKNPVFLGGAAVSLVSLLNNILASLRAEPSRERLIIESLVKKT